MLNRRILRVKAMQALYSYHLSVESIRQVTRDQLLEQLKPDREKDDFNDQEGMDEKRKMATLAGRAYDEALDFGKVTISSEYKHLIPVVNEYMGLFQQEVLREQRRVRAEMLKDLDFLQSFFLKVLVLPVEFAHLEKLEKEKKEKAHVKKATTWSYHLIDNPVCRALQAHPALSGETWWNNERDLLKLWYKEVIQQDERMIAYQDKAKPTDEEHHEAVVYLMRKVIFKSTTVGDYFISTDIRWEENNPILSSLVVKTLQSFNPETEEVFEFRELSKNEEDDISFFKELFDKTLEQDSRWDKIIAQKTKNWDISRVALMDRIILKMALTEMTTFPSIPVKVTINEFIEISKLYSTPKSKQFINGILDVLSNELTSEGVIKKSGRGLIDNK